MKFIQALLLCCLAIGGNVQAESASNEVVANSASTQQTDLASTVTVTDTEVKTENSTESQTSSLIELVSQLPKASYKEKAELLELIAADTAQSEKSLELLNAILKGELFYVKKTKQVVYREAGEDKKYLAIDALTAEEVGLFKKRKLKKIGINNSLRRTLKGLIAELQISSADENVREVAASEILKNADSSLMPIIEKALIREEEDSIRTILNTAKSIIELEGDVSGIRLGAISALDGSLYPETRVALTQFIERVQQHPEQFDEAELTLAQKNLDSINEMMKLNGILENVYFGIALGAVLLLAAIGLAITFGVMGVINMAHGEMIMLGAYTTFVIQQLMPESIGMSLLVSIPAAFLVSGLVGVIIERTVIRHLYGRALETLLATFGISLILQQAVRSIFGPLNQDVQTPDWMAGTFAVNAGLELTYNRLYIIIFSLLVLAALAVVLKKTLFGLQMRAVTMNRPMASSMGIKTGWVDALTFGLGSGIAGIAGVALSQLTNVGPNLGQAYIIDSFMVVVFGGVGNLWGTLVGAMSLGIANKVFEPMAGAVLAKIIVLVAIILFIQKRPRGLFALKGRAVED